MNTLNLKLIVLSLFLSSHFCFSQKIEFGPQGVALGVTISTPQKTYGLNARSFLAKGVSLDWNWAYDGERKQFKVPGGITFVKYLWTDVNDFSGVIMSTVGSTLLLLLPEGFTMSAYPMHNVSLNISPKPFQARDHKDISGIFNTYSSIEVSTDFMFKHPNLMISPYYGIGTFWDHSDSYQEFGLRVGLYVE